MSPNSAAGRVDAEPTRDEEADMAGRWLYGADCVMFKALAIGARFSFPTCAKPLACVKLTADGWYRLESTGQRFRTGTRTSTRPIPT